MDVNSKEGAWSVSESSEEVDAEDNVSEAEGQCHHDEGDGSSPEEGEDARDEEGEAEDAGCANGHEACHPDGAAIEGDPDARDELPGIVRGEGDGEGDARSDEGAHGIGGELGESGPGVSAMFFCEAEGHEDIDGDAEKGNGYPEGDELEAEGGVDAVHCAEVEGTEGARGGGGGEHGEEASDDGSATGEDGELGGAFHDSADSGEVIGGFVRVHWRGLQEHGTAGQAWLRKEVCHDALTLSSFLSGIGFSRGGLFGGGRTGSELGGESEGKGGCREVAEGVECALVR